MNNCHVFHHRVEDQVGTFNFSGNRPSLPPLTTEAVATIIYLVDGNETKK